MQETVCGCDDVSHWFCSSQNSPVWMKGAKCQSARAAAGNEEEGEEAEKEGQIRDNTVHAQTCSR
jgi:hypothetical protein